MTGPAHLTAATRLAAEQQLAPLRRALADRVPQGTPAMAHVVVVAGGKGGTGTSTAAQLLALAAAESGVRTLLVDADDAFATQHLLLGVAAPHALGDLRGGDVTPEAMVVGASDTLALLANADAAGESVGVAERRLLWRRVTPLYASWDLVLVDAGARLDGVLSQCALGAGRLVAVTTPDAIALAATHAVVKAATARFPHLPVDVLVSRADDAVARARFDHLEAGARRFLDRPLGFAGALPDDATLARAVGAGMPLPDAAAGTGVALAAHGIAARLVSEASLPSSSSASLS